MKKTNRILSIVITLTLLLMIAGCAGLRNPVERPEVSVVDMQIVELRPLEAEFLLFLRIMNSNPFPLDLTGLSCTLKIDGKHFASGIGNEHLQVPAFSSKVISVNVYASTLQMFSSLMGIIQEREQGSSRLFAYELDGTIRLDRQFRSTVNFHNKGELFLPGSLY